MPMSEPAERRSLAVPIALAAACLYATVAWAGAPVTASQAWIRWLPGDLPLAGYVTLENHSASALKLVGASSPDFKRIELHRSMEMGGMSHMRAVRTVTIPAHWKFRFAPGAYHLMLWRKHALKVGARLPITLKFADGSTLEVQFTVKRTSQ